MNSPTSASRAGAFFAAAGLLLVSLVHGTAAFSQDARTQLDYLSGKSLFERHWVSPPASTTASDGLGPLYNATSCDTCHPDGGAAVFDEAAPASALVLHFQDAGTRERLGRQWQPFAVRGAQAERFSPAFNTVHEDVVYPDGLRVTLSRLQVTAGEPGNTGEASIVSLRMPPDLHGIGLLEKVAGTATVGRFGWQAAMNDLQTQTGAALSRDLGLGNTVFPPAAGDCTSAQEACIGLAGITLSGDSPEAGDAVLRLLVAYLRGLEAPAVPPADDADQGRQFFFDLGCAECHQAELALQGGGSVAAFTDLALHDMGPGLADRTLQDEPVATRWRTAPLWSMEERLERGNARFLHDGRAATPEEAILWHGGEAAPARDAFMALDRNHREALLRWLSSL